MKRFDQCTGIFAWVILFFPGIWVETKISIKKKKEKEKKKTKKKEKKRKKNVEIQDPGFNFLQKV